MKSKKKVKGVPLGLAILIIALVYYIANVLAAILLNN